MVTHFVYIVYRSVILDRRGPQSLIVSSEKIKK